MASGRTMAGFFIRAVVVAVVVAVPVAVPVAVSAEVLAAVFIWRSPRGGDRLASVTGSTDPDAGV
ncbi:hypothetical protein GCM10010341_72490 [Streptomyces noursei]|nr:hypothetical protein GCM10010341_72490 [Streptomyces noursei]